MKLHQSILLLLTLKQVLPCQQFPGFVFVPDKDSHGNDIDRAYGSLDDIHDECEEDDTCKAFNTLGYLKHTVIPLNDVSWGSCGGVYIRCRDWAELKADVQADQGGSSGNPTPFFLCSGVHIANVYIDLDNKYVTIGCSDPVSGCVLDGKFPYTTGFEGSSTSFEVTLSDITLQDFDTAVLSLVGTVTLERCMFKDDDTALKCHSNGTIVVTDSEFEDSQQSAIQATSGCSATITGSTFTDNTNLNGGALDCGGSGTSCTVDSSTFDGNEATGSAGMGGAIYCRLGATCDIDMETCSFQNNVASNGPNVHVDSSSTCNL